MAIFFIKSLFCGCKIIACQSREEPKCLHIVNHSYKWICDNCINLSHEKLDERLENIKKNDNKIYISFVNGWYRSPTSPENY